MRIVVIVIGRRVAGYGAIVTEGVCVGVLVAVCRRLRGYQVYGGGQKKTQRNQIKSEYIYGFPP